MRRSLVIFVALATAGVASAVALAGVGGEPGARAAAVAAAGSFEVSNSRDGLPVFAAANLGPGGSARGTIEIADTGSVPVEVTLSRQDLEDTPGLGGGLLSGALTLTVTDVSAPAAPLPVYSGPLAAMPDRPAGRLEPGASRTYEFVGTLPAGDQNALQGASVSVAYSWTATEAETEAPGPGPDPEPTTPSPPELPGGSPAAPAETPARGESGVATDGLVLAVTKVARAVRGGRIVARAHCDAACAITVRGRLRASAAGRHRGAKVRFGSPARYRAGEQRLRIRVPAGLRLWLATASGKRRLRAKLTFVATGASGTQDTVRGKLRLRPPRRR